MVTRTILVLFLMTASASSWSADSAYVHLAEQMDRYHRTFYVYDDADAGGNHFIPSGWMGDWGDIAFDGDDTTDPFSGPECIRLRYSAERHQGCGWAGICWQYPENNWGNLHGHYDLRGATKLTFQVRGAAGGEKAEFKVGGINRPPYRDTTKPYCDSFDCLSTGIITLTNQWQKCSLDLRKPDTFAIYTDVDAGSNNHYFPTGKYENMPNLTIDCACTENPHSGPTCIKAVYNGQWWNGWCWQQPANNWHGDSGRGYDLSGATQLAFWGRTDSPRCSLKVGMGYPDDPSGEIFVSGQWVELGDTWSRYQIDIPDTADLSDICCGFKFLVNRDTTGARTFYLDDIKYGKLIQKNLSHVIGGFCWVTDTACNPSGATIYLDDVRYELDSATVQLRLNQPRFINSYVTCGTGSDRPSRNAAFTYDNALAMLAFLNRGSPDDQRRARLIGDAFAWCQEHDRDFHDHRLRNGYRSGDICEPWDSVAARLPGWWDDDSLKWFEGGQAVGSYTGDLAWAVLALLTYDAHTGEHRYDDAVSNLAQWIQDSCYDRVTGPPGYRGGFWGWQDTMVRQKRLTWKSSEHNLDVFAAFSRLAEMTGDSVWQRRADTAWRFVEAMWDSTSQHFWTGTTDTGTVNQFSPLDVQAWSLLASPESVRCQQAARWADSHCRMETLGYRGFHFRDTLKDGIWWEGTGQMCCAFQTEGETVRADTFLGELRRWQQMATGGNQRGIVACLPESIQTGLDWRYYARLHTGATAWYVFAESGYNPFWDRPIAIEREGRSWFHEGAPWLSVWPNPSASRLRIGYALPRRGQASLKVYSTAGRLVRTLVNGQEREGLHFISWQGDDDRGRKLASGIYFISLATDKTEVLKKAVTIK